VAVEEMLGVVDDFVDVFLQEADGVKDELQILLERDSEGVLRVKAPALAENAGDGRAAREQGPKERIFGSRHARLAGRAEGRVFGLRELFLASGFEKRCVARVRPGPAALDVGDAELVERTRDAELVLH